jgi:hypothetical protein
LGESNGLKRSREEDGYGGEEKKIKVEDLDGGDTDEDEDEEFIEV